MLRFILIRPTVWPEYTNVTDRQTDRQTTDRHAEVPADGRAIAYSEREHEFTFAKKLTYAAKLDRSECFI